MQVSEIPLIESDKHPLFNRSSLHVPCVRPTGTWLSCKENVVSIVSERRDKVRQVLI